MVLPVMTPETDASGRVDAAAAIVDLGLGVGGLGLLCSALAVVLPEQEPLAAALARLGPWLAASGLGVALVAAPLVGRLWPHGAATVKLCVRMLFAGCVVLVAGALAAELWLRSVDPRPPAPVPSVDPLLGPNRPDPLLGWSRRPGFDDWIEDGPGLRLHYHHNALGYRDIEPEPDDDRPCVLVLGDSLAQGFGVEAEEAVPAQLRRDLAGARVMVIACQGWSLDQMLLAYLRDGRPRAPRAVALLWMFEPGFDRRSPVDYGLCRPWFVGDALCGVPIQPLLPGATVERLAATADLLRAATGAVGAWRVLQDAAVARSELGRRLRAAADMAARGAGVLPLPAPTTLDLILRLAAQVRRDGGELLVLAVPGAHAAPLGVAAIAPAIAALRGRGIRVVDGMAALLPEGHRLYTRAHHPDPEGHRRLAQALRPQIESLLQR